MKLIYPISRHTSANSDVKRHVDDGNGKPLCGYHRGEHCYEQDDWATEPTCKKCIKALTGGAGK